VRDNLLGTDSFSPIIPRTEILQEILAVDLAARAREIVGKAGGHVRSRAASSCAPGCVPMACSKANAITTDPLPEFVGARAADLNDLMAGMLEANDRMRDDGLDPLLQAAANAFGFVNVHPFEGGNGRLHRCLIHHVLAERAFTPQGIVFPVSSVMLDRIVAARNLTRRSLTYI
jgi:hypothetical protein